MTILEAKDLSYFYQDGEKRRMIDLSRISRHLIIRDGHSY